ncbi:MAG: hypothetical protein H0W76_21820 [Pyrinomonadaceae bacterium]|nr:hypothetical protein [Pyrinomonadaceae bacterium]
MSKPRRRKTQASLSDADAEQTAERNLSVRDQKILCLRSGGICAFSGCGKHLIEEGTKDDSPVILGEFAHIVGHSRQGPRGDFELSAGERNKHDNFILLCLEHHHIVDSQPRTYSVQVLRQMKYDHEERISRAVTIAAVVPAPIRELKLEIVHSTLLVVTHVPQVVFVAPTKYLDNEEGEIKKRIIYPQDKDQLVPFFLADGGRLHTFHDLRELDNPFAEVIDFGQIEPKRAAMMWKDNEGWRRYIRLLNRSLYKFAGRKGVRYDPDHRRFYFTTEEGKERTVKYRPLNARRTTRSVVWQPITKATGERKRFWYHLAAGLRFEQFGERQWCFVIRPERHLTTDGVTPLESEKIGPKVTRLKARMYNEGYLTEVNFWRDYLSGGQPRFRLNFGKQSISIDTRLVTFDVISPGVPDDDKNFKNQVYEDDLFTLSEHQSAVAGEEFDWEEAEGEADDEAAF